MPIFDPTGALPRRFLYITAPVLLMGTLADQASKSWASVGAVEPRFLVPGYVVAYLVPNAGATLGLGRDDSQTSSVFAVLGIACGVILARVAYGDRTRWKPADFLAAGLLFAGIFGNCLDRVILGHVRDFLVTRAIPTLVFNVADIFVVVGCVTLLAARYRGGARFRTCKGFARRAAV